MELIPVTRPWLPTFGEFCEAIHPLWDTRVLTNMGELHHQLEKNLETYLKVPQVTLFANGHMALELTVQALRLSGEVITTPFSFASTTHAIVRNRLTPVFCDINDRDFTIDVEKLESLITPKTTAILPIHVYGNICNLDEIERIAKKHGLKVLYDAAHAFGVKYRGKGIGAFGDASMFSFHATKLFHSIEGGALTTADHMLGEDLYNLKNFGIRSPECVESVGANAKMNEFQAAMGLCCLRHISEIISDRRRVVERYCEKLKKIPGLDSSCWRPQENVEPTYAYFPLLVDETRFGMDRDALVMYLNQRNVFPRKYFYPLISDYDCYKDRYCSEKTPVAKRVSRQVLTLPLYSDLTEAQVDYVCDCILSAAQRGGTEGRTKS